MPYWGYNSDCISPLLSSKVRKMMCWKFDEKKNDTE